MKHLFISLLLLVFIGCTHRPEVVIPKEILQHDQMVALMVDVHIMESALSINMNQGSNSPDSLAYFNVFKKNNTTKKQYEASLTFYTQHPELLNKIYDDVITDISKKQAETVKK